MEKDEEHSVSNADVLSQSYSHGIEKISGLIKITGFDFHIPKEIIEEREKSWDSLFDKYSEEVSDDIELNINTLEPEAVVNVQWCSGHRTCMRKPASMIQYWIDTGNPPYNTVVCDNEGSDIGSSLSEKEFSTVHDNVTEPNKSNEQQEDNREESSSSVDTAVYILSNTNVTKKAETIALVEGAKTATGTDSCKHTASETQRTSTHNGNDTCVENENILHKLNTNVEMEANICNSNTCINKNADRKNAQCENNPTHLKMNAKSAIASNILSTVQSCNIARTKNNVPTSPSNDEKLLKENALDKRNSLGNTSVTKKDVNIKRSTVNVQKDNDQTNMNCSSTTAEDYEPEIDEIYSSQKSSTSISESIKPFRRKKLFSNRSSPIDLIPLTNYNKNDITESRPSVHPALESGRSVQQTTHLVKKNRVHFRKRRLQSIFSRESFSRNDSKIGANTSKIKKRKRASRRNLDSIESKLVLSTTQESSYDGSACETEQTNVRETLGEFEEIDTNKSQKRIQEESSKETQRDVKLTEKQAIVRLERLPQEVISLFLYRKSSNRENLSPNENARRVTSGKKTETRILSCEIQRLDVDTMDSDQSTILICECNDKSHTSRSVRSYLSSNDGSLQDCNSTDEMTEEMLNDDSPKPSAIDVARYVNLNPVVVLERLNVSLYKNNKTKSKRDLTEFNSEKSSRMKNVDHDVCREEQVTLDLPSSGNMIKNEILPNKRNGFYKKSKSNDSVNTRSQDFFRREGSVSVRRESKYSFLRLPSSDEDDDIMKLIETVRKSSKAKSMSTRTSENMENQALPVNVQNPPAVMTTVIASSEDDEGDQEKYALRGRKISIRSVQESTPTSFKKSPTKKNHQPNSNSSRQKKTEAADTLISPKNRSIPSEVPENFMRKKSSAKSGDRKEPKIIKSSMCLRTRLVNSDSDYDSDAFISVVNSKHTSLRSSKSAEKLRDSPAKKSPIAAKKIDTSIEFSLKEEKSEKPMKCKIKKKTLRSSVCRNLDFSDSSDSDESFIAVKAKRRSPHKKNSIQDERKTPTKAIIEGDTNSMAEKSVKSMKRTRRSLRHESSIISSGGNGMVNGNSFHFQSSDDDTEILYKKSKSISPDEKSNYFKINGAVQRPLSRIEKSSRSHDNITTNVTTKPLIFQTRPCYESDSD